MFDLKNLNDVKFVVDSDGKKAAVQMDIHLWEALVSYLEELEDRAIVKEKLARLHQGPEQSGAVSGKMFMKNGKAEGKYRF